jgi:esterase/lipase superfamily enzyme
LATGAASAQEPPPTALPPPPAEDWAKTYLADDPLAGDEQVTLDELRAALADEARRDTVIPRHFARASLSDDERREFLFAAFTDSSMVVRRLAAAQLKLRNWLGDATSSVLLRLAEAPDRDSRFAAIVALQNVSIAPELVSDAYWNSLLEALASNDAGARAAAESQFTRWGAAAVPFLMDAVESGEPKLRKPAAAMLAVLLRPSFLDQKGGGGGKPPTPGPTEQPTAEPVGPTTVAPTKARKSGTAEPEMVRDRDDVKPKDVRVYFGTNRQLVEQIPDPQPLLYGLPFLLLAAVGAIYWRLRRRKPDAPPHSRLATSLIVMAMSGVAIWSVFTWNDALRTQTSQHVGAHFGPRRNQEGKIYYGYCDVSIPPTHSIGKVEEPLLGPDDEDRHVVLKRTEKLEDEAFYQSVRKVLDGLPRDRRDCFVFVHGYNSTFEQAARRTAQIHFDLKFSGAPLFYSWPSRGALRHYPSDRNEIQYSYRYVKQFLLELSEKLDADRIHIIAHSMGTDAVGRAIAELGDRGRVFDQIVLAAPDIDADVFREQIAPAMAAHSQRTTLYCSNTDWALVASNSFNDGWRAGDSSGGIMVVQGADTVDASGIDTALLGHSYYGDCLPLLKDVQMLFEKNLPPAERELEPVKLSGPSAYWIFKHLFGLGKESPPQ